ncbi:unnamed protein product [Tetraodon nigroviridis]|uniref:(spotted green pufferfish) hypothetical protein n=1 Tax=Tetraodon nigroviridis TaxID=99883 RepID=Q4S5Y1_TETNG|nr:unnamed protein product [Tetraodon nigroviridis]
MLADGVPFQDLPYRDMEKLRQVRRDLIKAAPLVLISLPPFANYLVFVLIQRVEFRGVYHSLRARHHRPVIAGLQQTSHRIEDGPLRGRLLDLCAKVQGGQNPKASDILAVRGLFSRPPLSIKGMSAGHMVSKNFRLSSGKGSSSPALLFLCPHAETHQSSALPDAPPPGLPGRPPAEQPRPGAAPAGPGPGQTRPPSADGLGDQRGQSRTFHRPGG